MTINNKLSLYEFIRVLKKNTGDSGLEEKKIIEDVSSVAVEKTMRDLEKLFNLPEGEIKSVEKIFNYCSSKEERLRIVAILFDNLEILKNDYIINQVAALSRTEREGLYKELPALRDFMQQSINI